jgi:hypothetical protein
MSAHVETGDPLLDVHATCGCGRRNTNVKLFASFVEKVRSKVPLDGEDRVGTWWCWRCRTVAILTARRTGLAA